MKRWKFFTTKEIKADGWLQRQLQIQSEGLGGNLDKVWNDVKNSKWIGGECEGWERVPYWLDGFIPVAYLLENEDMIARAKKYIDAIISHQKPDGWICPCEDEQRETYDTWAVLLIAKVLTVYYECSNDERIPKIIYDILKNYYELLKEEKIKLFSWGKFRWFEGFIAIEFTYSRCKEAWLVELAKILHSQGIDYNELTPRWKRPLNAWKFDTHIVNIVMALKYEAISYKLLGKEYTDKAEDLYKLLYEYNGTPVELFTGDECLSGLSPIQGTELCAVVEQMYSYEHLYAHTGDFKWAQRLEVLAFNALPAALSDDTWSHQYDQMSNQIACERFPGKPIFRTNRPDSHLFGLEPQYGCCTANFSQGWPKFVLSTFMHNDDEIINVVSVPSKLDCDKAIIRLETDYPFENSFKYTVKAKKDFTFRIRIPDFAKNLIVDGQKSTHNELVFNIRAGEERQICVSYETVPYFEKRPYDLNCVKCGSLVFSLPISYEKKMLEYEKDGVERKYPYCDYEYSPTSDWEYAYCSDELDLCTHKVDEVPFSSQKPAVTIKTKVRKIDWGLEDGYESVCAKLPVSRIPQSPAKEMILYPYGCAKLRMTEMPFIDKE